MLDDKFLNDFADAPFRMKCLVNLNRKRLLEIYKDWRISSKRMPRDWIAELEALCGYSPNNFSGTFFTGMAEYINSLGDIDE